MIEKPEFTGVNEDFMIIFNTAGAENMNRAMVSQNYKNVAQQRQRFTHHGILVRALSVICFHGGVHRMNNFDYPPPGNT